MKMKKLVNMIWFFINRFRFWFGALRRDSKILSERYPQYKIGRGSYGPLKIEEFGDGALVEIGAFCSFARGVTILAGGEHNMRWVTTFPFDRAYFEDTDAPHSSFSRGDVVIGNDVWVGTDVLILSGSIIGNGAVIGARSVVCGNVPAYSVVVGSPAKVVKSRFPAEVISELEKICWWNWSDEKIKKHLSCLMQGDVHSFMKIAKDL